MLQWFNEQESLHIVMLPKYREEENAVVVTEEMKQQGIWVESDGQWYFRITKEQYEDLEEEYLKAYNMAMEKEKEVSYTYEELFDGID